MGNTLWNPKALEDHAATAYAVQNVMLSLASEGCVLKTALLKPRLRSTRSILWQIFFRVSSASPTRRLFGTPLRLKTDALL